MGLKLQYKKGILEAGADEAGRGCLAGPVVAGAVILPKDFTCPELNDSKKLSLTKRLKLREIILKEALSWNIGVISHQRIDQINILNASFEAMHEAINGLNVTPHALAIDGNRFKLHEIPHTCIIKGDGKYMNIAAASILAKTFRDEIMQTLDSEYPAYNWKSNKGYPTPAHKRALIEHGISPYHRRSFKLLPQPTLF